MEPRAEDGCASLSPECGQVQQDLLRSSQALPLIRAVESDPGTVSTRAAENQLRNHLE